MPIHSAPPPVVDCARVLEFARVDNAVNYTGQQELFVNAKPLGPVPRLAICENLAAAAKGVLILHCDTSWSVLGSCGASSVREAKAQVERAYSGIGRKWIPSNYSSADVKRCLDENWSVLRCCICSKWPFEVDRLFQGSGASICSGCATRLHGPLVASNTIEP